MRDTKDTTAISFGGRVRQAREARGWTQEKLAEALSVSKAQISHYEAGRDAPSYDKLITMATNLQRSCNWLLTGREGVGGRMIDPESYDLILRLNKLPRALREFVLGALHLAEETRPLIPERFVREPSAENWQEFNEYLLKLAETIKKDDK